MSPAAPDTRFFVDLERSVWDAMVAGDATADASHLSDDFLGVYPSGFAGRAEHAAQLADGPTVAWYGIEGARTLAVTAGHVLLAYLARYRRVGATEVQEMYVSSLWSQRDDGWRNVFSQDTPVGSPDSFV